MSKLLYYHYFLEKKNITNRYACMILGHGVDIVKISRIERVYKRFGVRFLRKVLSEIEISKIPSSDDKIIHFLAKHWAVKEAVSKSIGCGLINGSPLHFNDIILQYTWAKMPIIRPSKNLLNITAKIHNLNFNEIEKIFFHVSTSDDDGLIIASVILEKNN